LNVLIIGYGSIGKRHEEVLSGLAYIQSINIVTKQTLVGKRTFKHLESIENLEVYDYFVIASKTSQHYEQLKYLESQVRCKLIFCEKPLFETYKEMQVVHNHVYIGYVLRFHPLLEKLKTLLENETILAMNVMCGQYLPTWRDADYRTSYSAKKSEGGGVLLDLSHEIDYVQWLCGNLVEMKSYQMKLSDLEIDSDDIVSLIGRSERGALVTLSLDYITKISYRRVLLHTVEYSYDLDFMKGTLVQKGKQGREEVYSASNLERNEIFVKMHDTIIKDKKNVCTFFEAMRVMKTVGMVQEQNSE
jgi:CMP-N,N'-diacetyllegionaminic acid synthase